jgi:hypothetical protein
MPDPTANLIAKAEAVANLWDLVLFTTGQTDARQKRADVMHEAVMNLRATISTAKADTGNG